MDSVINIPEAWISSTQLLIPFIAVIGTIIVAVISSYVTYRFTRKMQLEAEWRKDKLIYYSRLIESITETMSWPKDFEKTYRKYAHTFNVISLIAPQEVANIIFEYYFTDQRFWMQEMTHEEESRWTSDQKRRLQQLVLAMRKDLRIKPKDDPKTFQYRLRSPLHPKG